MNKKVHMNIGGMTCIHCQNTIEKTLKNAKGVIKASVSYKRGTADIEYDDSVTHVNKLVRAIENEDYKVLSSGEKTSPGVLDTLGILVIIAGLVMVLMGINMLGIFPGLRRFSVHMPAGVAKVIGEKSRTSKEPFIVGLLNGFMPCGPLQAMWIVAFASASPVTGALSMLMFSLGTVPLMLGLGSVVSLLGKKFTTHVMRVGASLTFIAYFYNSARILT